MTSPPLNLQPRPGRGWFPAGRPARRRATYTRTGGVRHLFAALDLASGQLFYRFRDRMRWREFLGFLKQLRTRFPTGRLYLGCDNFSPHGKDEVHDWRTRHSRRSRQRHQYPAAAVSEPTSYWGCSVPPGLTFDQVILAMNVCGEFGRSPYWARACFLVVRSAMTRAPDMRHWAKLGLTP
jgi:DDE superfamily endonuclease